MSLCVEGLRPLYLGTDVFQSLKFGEYRNTPQHNFSCLQGHKLQKTAECMNYIISTKILMSVYQNKILVYISSWAGFINVIIG